MSETKVSYGLKVQAANEGAVAVLPKSPLTSKTLLFSVLNLVVGVTTYLMGPEVVKEYPVEFVTAITLVNGIVSAILRTFTGGPLTISPGVPTAVEKYSLLIALGLLGLVASPTYAQEPANKPSVSKLQPSAPPAVKPSDAPGDDVSEENTDNRRVAAAGQLLRGGLTNIRDRRKARKESGVELHRLMETVRELESEGLVDRNDPYEEILAEVAIRTQDKNPEAYSGLSGIDLQALIDLIDRWLPTILKLLGWIGAAGMVLSTRWFRFSN